MQVKAKSKTIMITGGGTGGHLFPGIAIAQSFMKKNNKNRVIFIGTGKPFEKKAVSAYGFQYASIPAEGLKNRGIVNQFRAILKIPIGVTESLKLFQKFRPDLVVGVGGYSSGPAALAAAFKRIPIVLQEQNIFPGITNRILSVIADRIYVSFQHTIGLNPKKTLWTGNPVRNEFHQFIPNETRRSDLHVLNVLILGGSQGAHAINKAVMDALALLDPKEQFYFIHQTGMDDERMVKDAYEKIGISHTVAPFFDDMPDQYRQADLLICRAGATTVAEAAVMGKPAIYIPFPFAADNHQELNARSMLDAKAADILLQSNLSGAILAEKIRYYASHPDVLRQMAICARRMGKPNAADTIVDDCYAITHD